MTNVSDDEENIKQQNINKYRLTWLLFDFLNFFCFLFSFCFIRYWNNSSFKLLLLWLLLLLLLSYFAIFFLFISFYDFLLLEFSVRNIWIYLAESLLQICFLSNSTFFIIITIIWLFFGCSLGWSHFRVPFVVVVAVAIIVYFTIIFISENSPARNKAKRNKKLLCFTISRLSDVFFLHHQKRLATATYTINFTWRNAHNIIWCVTQMCYFWQTYKIACDPKRIHIQTNGLKNGSCF